MDDRVQPRLRPACQRRLRSGPRGYQPVPAHHQTGWPAGPSLATPRAETGHHHRPGGQTTVRLMTRGPDRPTRSAPASVGLRLRSRPAAARQRDLRAPTIAPSRLPDLTPDGVV